MPKSVLFSNILNKLTNIVILQSGSPSVFKNPEIYVSSGKNLKIIENCLDALMQWNPKKNGFRVGYG
jgi:hypothetical protein